MTISTSTVSALDLEHALTTHLIEAGFKVFRPRSDDLPTVVAADSHWGLLVVDLVDHEDGALVALNRKLARLRDDIPEIARVPAQRFIVAGDATTSRNRTSSVADAADGIIVAQLTASGM